MNITQSKPPQSDLLILKEAIYKGTMSEQFKVGTIISDTWTDVDSNQEYQMPLLIVDYRTIRLPNGKKTFGAILLRKHALPFRIRYGNPRLDQSILLKWANSSSYFGPMEKHGHLAGCSKELLATAAPIVIKPDSKQDSPTTLRFFPPSLDELELSDGSNAKVEDPWEYFQRARKPPIFTDPFGEAQDCWLRSTRRGGNAHVWTINIHKSATLHNATTQNFCILACAITGQP